MNHVEMETVEKDENILSKASEAFETILLWYLSDCYSIKSRDKTIPVSKSL